MKRLPLVAIFLTTLYGCGEETEHAQVAHTLEKRLEWVESSSPGEEFKADIAIGKLHFLSVCSVTCMVPGVTRLNAEICYPTMAIEQIPDTGDVFFSERQKLLQDHVWEFARDYNLLAAKSSGAMQQNICNAGEDWNKAFGELSKLVRSSSTDPAYQEGLSFDRNHKIFNISLSENVSVEKLHTRACAVLQENNVANAAHLIYRIGSASEITPTEKSCSGHNVSQHNAAPEGDLPQQ